MRAYGIYRNTYNEKFRYARLKLESRIHLLTIRDKKIKEVCRTEYEENFNGEKYFLDNDNSIPNAGYCIPISFISVDIIEKENTDALIQGLQKLCKKCLAHNYLASIAPDIYEEFIEKMNNDTSSAPSWTNCGIFELPYNSKKVKSISRIGVKIINCSLSYYAIEIVAFLTEERIAELTKFINSSYHATRGIATRYYYQKNGKPGSKIRYSVSFPNNNTRKSDILNNMFLYTKWALFQELSEYLPILLHRREIAPPSIIIYKTNIKYSDIGNGDFWRSIGADFKSSDFFDTSDKLFYSRDTDSNLYPCMGDMIYIVNDVMTTKELMYSSIDYQIVETFKCFFEKFYKILLARTLLRYYESSCSEYRNILYKNRRTSLNNRKLLSMRYEYERGIDIYRRFFEENDWNVEVSNTEKVFVKIVKVKSHALIHYDIILENVQYEILMIDKIRNKIEVTLDQKIKMADHKYQYENANKNLLISRFMLLLTILMLIISVITLLVVLNPAMAKSINLMAEKVIKILIER